MWKKKAFFIIFKELSVAKNCLKTWKCASNIYRVFVNFKHKQHNFLV